MNHQVNRHHIRRFNRLFILLHFHHGILLQFPVKILATVHRVSQLIIQLRNLQGNHLGYPQDSPQPTQHVSHLVYRAVCPQEGLTVSLQGCRLPNLLVALLTCPVVVLQAFQQYIRVLFQLCSHRCNQLPIHLCNRRESLWEIPPCNRLVSLLPAHHLNLPHGQAYDPQVNRPHNQLTVPQPNLRLNPRYLQAKMLYMTLPRTYLILQ